VGVLSRIRRLGVGEMWEGRPGDGGLEKIEGGLVWMMVGACSAMRDEVVKCTHAIEHDMCNRLKQLDNGLLLSAFLV
jgi:hypothetical protein